MDFQSQVSSHWIIWSDADLLVINKPAGLLSLPDGFDQSQPYLQSILEPEFGRLWIVHRLDRETSGVIVLARSSLAHHLLNDQFSSRQVRKVYHAIIEGLPSWDQVIIDLPLRKNGDRKHRTIIDQRYGKPAQTEVTILERFSQYALLNASPRTGYTHQIRAHLAAQGFPLAGDPLYGGPDAIISQGREVISRVALHAYQIAFTHPTTNQPLQFRVSYPEDFQNALTSLREQNG